MTAKVDPTEFEGKRVLVTGAPRGWAAPPSTASGREAPG